MVDEELLKEETSTEDVLEENQSVVEEDDNKQKKFGIIVKILLIILILLLLLSLSVLLIRLADFLPNNRDIIFIEPKVPNGEVYDDEIVWSTDTEINIFRTKEVNESGQIVVESSSGDKIIAPGMEGSYRFYVKNLGNIALDTKTILDVKFIAENLDYDYETLPIEIRFLNYRGESLTKSEWISVDEFEKCIDELTIGKNRYIYYTVEWRWLFETDNDELDTLLGNLSADSNVELTISIVSSATQSEEYDAEGGLSSGLDDPRTGGDLVPVPYIVLNLLILLIIIALIILEIIKRKKKSEEIERIIEQDENTLEIEKEEELNTDNLPNEDRESHDEE